LENTLNKSVDSKIQDYEGNLKELKDVFQGHAVLQTEITVSRILDMVDSLGKRFCLFMNTCLIWIVI